MIQLLAQITNPALTDFGSGEGNETLALLMARLFRTMMIIGGLGMLMYLVWGGVNWITAGNDAGKVEQAKNRMMNAVIGMALLVATVAIVILLTDVFGFDLLNPTLPTN